MLVKSRLVNSKNRDNGNKNKYVIEKVSKNIFFISALIAVLSLFLIIGFVFYKGLTPFILKGYSFGEFLTGTDWLPTKDKFGISSMVVASIIATVGALIIG
ncbi:MAG: phosphate ABC transporter permease subunit PstC, partial [Clostridium sp.]